jgi:hypothetical protein
MGVPVSLSQSNIKLSFLLIKQEWLRTAVKSYLSYCLPLYSASICRTRLQSMACFSNFPVTERTVVPVSCLSLIAQSTFPQLAMLHFLRATSLLRNS